MSVIAAERTGAVIEFAGAALRDLEGASRKEWLETNGAGGFASSSILGLNTRRYHALLTAALPAPMGRVVLLSKLEETLRLNDAAYDLGANQYPGTLHPRGCDYLSAFRLDPFPTFVYQVGDARLEKQVAMPRGRNAVVITYTLTGEPWAALDLYPLLAFRDYHQLSRENPYAHPEATFGPEWVRFALYDGMPGLYLSMSAVRYRSTGYWYRQLEYLRELERGLDFREDLFNPAELRLELTEGVPVRLIAGTEPATVAEAAEWVAAERLRRGAWRLALGASLDGEVGEAASRDAKRQAPSVKRQAPIGEMLARAADAFLIRRPDGAASVIAGYPWFTDWGRDTMIALPGLTLTTGRFDEARGILTTFAHSASEGMIPNRFPDGSETPDYNTVDATLWMFVAAWRLFEATGDREFIERELLPVFESVIDWHRRGTRYGIHVDADGLLAAGAPGVQLTWMDAKVGDWVVTPRSGKPVEINALWYNALRIGAALARPGRPALADDWEVEAERTRVAFERAFWDEERGYLADVVDAPGVGRDFSLRPNQMFALSLPFPLVEGARARRVLEKIAQRLLTPYGLRTLDPADPRYCGRYEGDPHSRDGCYHQGTVWPWLIGGYWEARLRRDGFSEAAKAAVRAEMQPLIDHLWDAGLGSVSEIFDGDPPHRPCGCIAQAWSVAELLRLWVMTAS
jgi:predicted glycogen debranching enzyme